MYDHDLRGISGRGLITVGAFGVRWDLGLMALVGNFSTLDRESYRDNGFEAFRTKSSP